MELLNFIDKKCQELTVKRISANAYNVLMFNVVKILHMMLQFGMFNQLKAND
jgi:hypothetical protein